MSPDLIQELRDKHDAWQKQCDVWVENWKSIGGMDAVAIDRLRRTVYGEAADALTTKDTALAEARAMSDAHREHAQSAVENSASLNRLLSIAEARAEAAEASLADLAAENERLTSERDEARLHASLGCDAADGGPHTIVAEGSYKFCHKCGQTIKNPTLHERARTAEAENARLRGSLIACGRNVGAGLADSVSSEFLMLIPEEVRLVVERLRNAARALQDEAGKK